MVEWNLGSIGILTLPPLWQSVKRELRRPWVFSLQVKPQMSLDVPQKIHALLQSPSGGQLGFCLPCLRFSLKEPMVWSGAQLSETPGAAPSSGKFLTPG